MTSHLVLVHTPDPDDGIPASSEQAVQGGVQLQGIYPIAIVLLHFISYDVRYLPQQRDVQCIQNDTCKSCHL